MGGKAISFVQTFYGLSYPDAVKRLLDGEGIAYPQAQPKSKEKKQFALPPANQNMRRTYAYLLQERLISRDILSAFTTSTALPVMPINGAFIPTARAIGAM